MNIIAEFEHPEFAKKCHTKWWKWGLGYNGNIYYQRSDVVSNLWYMYESCQYKISSIREMEQIVNKFGHLVPFL